MTIGIRQIQARLIQADSRACQAVSITPVVSPAMVALSTGGRPQSLAPTHGDVGCSPATTMLTVTRAIETTASQLVASGIKIYLTQYDHDEKRHPSRMPFSCFSILFD